MTEELAQVQELSHGRSAVRIEALSGPKRSQGQSTFLFAKSLLHYNAWSGIAVKEGAMQWVVIRSDSSTKVSSERLYFYSLEFATNDFKPETDGLNPKSVRTSHPNTLLASWSYRTCHVWLPDGRTKEELIRFIGTFLMKVDQWMS